MQQLTPPFSISGRYHHHHHHPLLLYTTTKRGSTRGSTQYCGYFLHSVPTYKLNNNNNNSKKDKNKTYSSEEGFDVFCLGVDDNVANVTLFNLTQHLTVGADSALTDVHLHFAGGWRTDQILQPDQSCTPSHDSNNNNNKENLISPISLFLPPLLIAREQQQKSKQLQNTLFFYYYD